MKTKDQNGGAKLIRGKSVMRYLQRNKGVLLTFLLLLVLLSVFSPPFLTPKTMLNVSRQLSTNMLLTFSLMLCILMGSIDLSVGPVVSSSGIVMLTLLASGLPLAVSMTAAVCYGAVIGTVNGALVAYTGVPPFIITMSTMNMIKGACYLITDSQTLRGDNTMLRAIGRTYLFGFLAVSLLVTVVIAFGCYILLNKTATGTAIYAIGGNPDAAKNAGIHVARVKLLVHILSSTFAAVAGVLLSARMYSATARLGDGYEADAIGAAVLGGISFAGGRGTLGGAIIGALIIAFLGNGMNSVGVSDNWQYIVKGALIIAAVFIDTMVTKNRKRRLFEQNRESERRGKLLGKGV